MDNVIALAERNVPRYTSYPTAPHFTAAVDASAYADWLRAIPADATLSLYLHVPYCTEICRYCGCHTKAYAAQQAARRLRGDASRRNRTGRRRADRPPRRASALGRRHALDSRSAAPRGHHLSDLGRFRFVRSGRACDRARSAPDEQRLAQALAAIGITRASLGVQEFSAHVQRAIGRIQPFDVVKQAVARPALRRHRAHQYRSDVRAAAADASPTSSARPALPPRSSPRASRCSAMRMCPGSKPTSD